ncbi:uncharacterized protein F5147DRAFT_652930 [Suillus discolor]|uniref:Uncharacterized protein n=1 Tax=Suillus discolor TaxID=1912936 RepID=A0A9P7F7A6_9AGAM|nr:uncharacterized protein F5147DRAFT_652930 [Suillus discolor]KAG2108209.1 hypothetical protein F5147DRAFT_652930 [Suillus discolor]
MHEISDSNVEQPMEVLTPNPDPRAPQNMQPSETVLPLAVVEHLTNTPVGWFDLLATNEWVDVLDTRLHSVEETLDWRLTVLEKRLSTSNLQWKATSSSLGNLSMALQKHRDNQIIHRHRESIFGDGSSQQRNVGLVDEEGVSHIGRQPGHVSTRRLDNNARSAPPGTSGE